MEALKEKLSVIFELDQLDATLKFTDLDEWDSLSSLSILAMLDSDYNMAMSNADLLTFATIQDFCDHVIKNRK
ncbi:MAG: phosphopantetheine-binding protein [Bacteroidales bacterium]